MTPKDKKYFNEIRKIEKDLSKILVKLHSTFPKPLNLQEEKKKFFGAIADDKIYNPRIRYQRRKFNKEAFKELKKFKINTWNDKYKFKKLIKQKVKSKIIQYEYHKKWGDPKTTKYVLKYWGKPSKSLLKKAEKICKNFERETVKFKTLTPIIAGNRLKKEVKKLTNHDIKVKYPKDMAAKVNIEAHDNYIEINPNERFTSLDVKRLKVHEIGTHYMRYYNAHKFKIKILETGTPNYLETEEGLAAYSEYLKGVSSKAQMYIYAGRVIATYHAPKKSFYEIFQILKSFGFKEHTAFAITFRAKRNICDTSQPGGFTKDYVYFKGFYKLQKFAKHNDIRDLFIGKIKIEDLKTLKKFIKNYKQDITTIFDKKPTSLKQ